MWAWAALLIPLLTVAILAIFFHHRIKWWEFALPFVGSLLLIAGGKGCAEYSLTQDTEIWNDYVIQARYYERWDEYIHRTCSSTSCTGTGNSRSCHTTYYDCSYVANHPEHWTAETDGKQTISINQPTYNYLVQKYGGGKTFHDMRRNFHRIDGDMYYSNWPQTVETVEPVNFAYSYENRVQASRSVFKFEQISDEQAQKEGLFAYPEVRVFDYPSVLGDCGPNTKMADRFLSVQNALLGAKKELRMWLLCADTTDPTFAQRQEAYWVGGNKNEVVVVVGLDKEKRPVFVHPFSWTSNKEPLIEIRDSVAKVEPLDPINLANTMAVQLEQKFKRRDFADFAYLTVEPPTWAYVLIFALTIALNIGVAYFAIYNEWYDKWYPDVLETTMRTTKEGAVIHSKPITKRMLDEARKFSLTNLPEFPKRAKRKDPKHRR